MLAFSLLLARMLYLDVNSTREIIITDDEIIAPRNSLFFNKKISIKFNEIKTIRNDKRLIVIRSLRGDMVFFRQSMLPDKQTFDELGYLLVERFNNCSFNKSNQH